MTRPDCPQCGSNRTYGLSNDEDSLYKCKQCSAEFENDDEDSNYFTDPTLHIQIIEEREQKERKRRRRKRWN